jgi:hypothetical protein
VSAREYSGKAKGGGKIAFSIQQSALSTQHSAFTIFGEFKASENLVGCDFQNFVVSKG